nr:hypothetical transcript [Hymenolepis microstoma]
MQVTSDSRSTSFKCFQTVIKSTGVSTLYRAYFTQLALNVPFQCVHFVTYEFLQRKLNPDKQYKPWTHIVSGGIAGGTAAAITTPLDVCKTVLNTQVSSFLDILGRDIASGITFENSECVN